MTIINPDKLNWSQKMDFQRSFIVYLLIICLLTPLTVGYGQGTWSGQYESCYFQYGYNDPNLTQFRFERCLWPVCVQQLTVANISVCIYHANITESSWSLCSLRCCYNSLPQSYQSFQECEEVVETVSHVFLAIFLSVILVIILIFGIRKIVWDCSCPKCGQCLSDSWNHVRRFFQKIGVRIRQIFTCQCIKEKDAAQSPKQCKEYINNGKDLNAQSSILTIEFIQKNQYTCGICNQERPTLQLECGHSFHKQCIADHLELKKQCATCHSCAIDKVTVSCESCNSKYVLPNLAECYEDLRKNKQLCGLCNMSQNTSIQ